MTRGIKMRTIEKINQEQQEIDMAEIDAMKTLEMARLFASLVGKDLIESKSPRIAKLGAKIADIGQESLNLLNEFRYGSE